MDAKEVKSLLKQAREAIKEKDFKAALKTCKFILNSDKENYNAWVFVGVAAQELEQYLHAEEAFQKAIEIAPDQILAWQGLCNFYEKQKDNQKFFMSTRKLLELFDKDKSKQEELIGKLTNVANIMGDKEKVVEVLQLQLSLYEDNEPRALEIWKETFDIICSDKNLGQKLETLRKEALMKLVQQPSLSDQECKKLIEMSLEPLCQAGLDDKCLEIMTITSCNPVAGQMCAEFLLKASLAAYLNEGRVMSLIQDLLQMAEKYETIKSLCHLNQGLLHFVSNKCVLANNELKLGLMSRPNYIDGLYIQTKAQLGLHLNKEAEVNARLGLKNALKTSASSTVIGNFYLLLGEALSGCRKWEAAFKAYEKCVEYLGRTAAVLRSFCIALLEVGHVQEAQKMYAELYSLDEDPDTMLDLEGYLHFQRQEFPAALQKLRKYVSLGQSAFALHLIGCVLWKTEEYDKSVKVFVKAAELDPYFSQNFLYLGNYYRKFSPDGKKAKQCYQKAFDLDFFNEEAAKSLCAILQAEQENDAYVALLRKITLEASASSWRWAWTQLGLHLLETCDLTDAIFSLQNAVRIDPRNSYGWECLGDAYFKRGSYESALKAFEKSSELNSSAMYPLYQISTIQKMRNMFEDAAEHFKKLLELAPTYVPALLGLSETLVLWGKQSLSECLYCQAKRCFQEALSLLARIISSTTSLSCLWKLAADACTYASFLGQNCLPIDIPPEFKIELSDASSKENLLQIANKFYGRALALNENLSSLWHDLGLNCYFQSQLVSVDLREDMAKKALLCLQKAITISPNNHRHWTALGIVAVSPEIQDNAFGQHAFIKSIECESNNVEAWTNLGVLYFESANIDLAHQAFKVAQSLDPSFPLCWIGQAIIAHKVKHTETMDLYRHATTLGSHSEALIGYGRAVCQVLLDTSNRGTDLYKYNVEQMDALVVASDCLVKYTENSDDLPEAFNMLGMLFERQKLFNGALRSYKKALDLLDDGDKIDEVRINYGRLLSVVGKHAEAIAEFTKLKKVDPSVLCSFGYILYKNKEFKKSYQVFGRALESCKDDSQKSHIMVAMALVAFKLPAPEKNNTPKLLLESSRMQPPSATGLLSLWALGLLDKNFALAASVKNELVPFQCMPEYSSSISLLAATQSYIQHGISSARSTLLCTIRSQPNNAEYWMQLAFSMLHWNPEYAEVASKCSQVAVFHNGNKELASQIFALSRLAVGYKGVSLSAAQKAVHIRPDKLSNWIALTAASHVTNRNRKDIGWIFKFVKNLAKQQGIETEVLGWLICMDVFHNICCKEIATASKIIKHALAAGSLNSQTQSTLEILNAFIQVVETGKLDVLVLAVTRNASNFLGWQILVRYLLRQEKYDETEKTLQKFVIASSRYFPRLRSYPLLLLLTLSLKAMHVTNDKEKWRKLGEDTLVEVVKAFPDNQAARFLQGLFALETDNTSLTRRCFEKVIFNSVIKESKWMDDIALKVLLPLYEKKGDQEALQKISQRFPEDERIKLLLHQATEKQLKHSSLEMKVE